MSKHGRQAYRPLRDRGDALGLGVLGYLVLSVVLSILEHALRPQGEAPLFRLFFTLASPLGLAIPFLVASKALGLALPKMGTPRREVLLPAVVMGVGVASVGNMLSALFARLLALWGHGALSHQPVFTENPISNALVLLGCTLLAAFFEELVFRGVVLQALRPWGSGFALVAQALLFAACHQSVLQVLPAFLSGLAFGYFALVSGSLWPSMATHLVYNSLALVVNLVAGRLGGTAGALLSTLCLLALAALGAWTFLLWRRVRHPVPRQPALPPLAQRLAALWGSPALLVALAALLLLQSQSIIGA